MVDAAIHALTYPQETADLWITPLSNRYELFSALVLIDRLASCILRLLVGNTNRERIEMFGIPAEIIQMLSDDLCVEHNLIIEEIKKSSSMVGVFRDVVEDISDYPLLLNGLAERF